MVDKATARLLVYGALGTLALILIVAIYALATKGSLQSELEKKLDMLKEKEHALTENAKRREEALKMFREAEVRLGKEGRERQSAEEQRDHYKDKYDHESHEKSDYADESERLRRKLWDKSDQQKLEDLEKLSEDQLMKELEQEGDEFFANQKDLEGEHLEGEDQKDLDHELGVAKNFHDQFDKVKEKLHDDSDEGDADALENLEEFGEQNEVYLDELDRDAKRNSGKKWKEGKRPGKMGELVKDMDLHAEALRNKKHEKKLAVDDKDLDNIEHEAEEQMKEDKEFAPVVDEVAKEIEADEERLMREMNEADEGEEDDAAGMLEHDAEKDEVKLAHLEQLAQDSDKLSPAQKAEREKLIKDLEKELEDMEGEAQDVEKGLERRHVRQDAVKMAKAVNRLSNQPLQKLKHGKKAINDVEEMLHSESAMLQNMKKGDVEAEEKYGRQLAEEAQGLEEDAGILYDEADAGDFDDLDEKLIDEQLAKELDDAGEDMEHDAGGVEHDDHSRELREDGEEIEASAEHLGEKELKQFGKADKVKKKAHEVEQEALELGKLVGEQNWQEEVKTAKKALHDVEELDDEADDLEKEVRGADPSTFDKEEKDEDLNAIKRMRQAGAKLKKEAQAVGEDVKFKAEHKSQKLEEELRNAKDLMQDQA